MIYAPKGRNFERDIKSRFANWTAALMFAHTKISFRELGISPYYFNVGLGIEKIWPISA